MSFSLVGTIRAPQASAPNRPVLVTTYDAGGLPIDQARAVDDTTVQTIGTP